MNEINIMDVKEKPFQSSEESDFPPTENSSLQEAILASSLDETHDQHHEEEEDQPKKGAASDHSYIEGLIKEIEHFPEVEVKLQKVIDFMEQSLAQTGSPHFKSFWQARGLCLQLFKENVSPAMRSTLWTKYTELSKEARRLKDLLDEQSSFAVEQIEIAIQALENDVAQLDKIEELPPANFEIASSSLRKNKDFYISIQNQLDLLNKQASRINALRKELIKTEMRVRKKNKFFQRLSQLGDKVFPKRKELIASLSNRFIEDVDMFISHHFSKEDLKDSLFILREEIKALQGTAKLFTLNTHAFTQTRMRLSECWDKIKNEEKERKKVRSQQKTAFKANMDQVFEKLEEAKKAIGENQLSPAEGNKKIDEVAAFMRSVELGRDEIQHLREQIAIARKPLLELMKSEEQKRQELEQEKQHQKQIKIQEIRDEIEQLIRSVDSFEANQLGQKKDSLLEKIQNAGLLKSEKIELERQLKPLRDIIADKKAMSLTALSADERQAHQQLKDALHERKELRNQIKEQLETLRRGKGASGLDFEKAMEYNSQIQIQKERLEKINQAVSEIEKKITDLEKQ